MTSPQQQDSTKINKNIFDKQEFETGFITEALQPISGLGL